MRLLSLELNGFRGFPQKHAFDLDADAVIVVGANGHGKTSLFDGILWALSGRIPRLHNDDSRLVSMYSETGQARVELRLKDPLKGSHFTITRSFDGQEGRVSLETPEGSYQGPSAEGRLIDLIWSDAAAASKPHEALAAVLTRSVYLQQDLIQQFVEAASDQDRFAAVSELVGAGRVTELQASLERAKKAWSTTTNQRRDELHPFRERLAIIEARLSDLTVRVSQSTPAIEPDMWGQWWHTLSDLGLKAVQVEPTSREAPTAIDTSIKQLDALRRATERRLQVLRNIQTQMTQLANEPIPEIPPLREKLATLQKQLDDLKYLLTEEQARLAEQRRYQAMLKEKNEQLKALAALALNHLEELCPVCAQTYDKEATRLRLEATVREGVKDISMESITDKLTPLLANLASKEKEVAAAELGLRLSEQIVKERYIAQQILRQGLSEIDVANHDQISLNIESLDNAIKTTEAMILRAAESQVIGESMALRLAQSSATAAMDELRQEAEILQRENTDREEIISARDQTGELAQRVIEALREAASAVVEERLRQIGPVLQSIYARIDPHPAFRLVTFLSQVVKGKGQLSTVVRDPIEEKQSRHPASILSSSQVNALAASVFLALNIGVSKPPLAVAILDDPLQSLDDINLLGLVDLLRRTKDRRQLCVSTHDWRFGSLLARKLRPSDEKGRTIVIELNGWSRQGPIVVEREVKCDPVQLRLVASRTG